MIALWDQDTNNAIYASSQNIHVMRDTVANMLNVDPNSIVLKRLTLVADLVKEFCY